MFIERNYSRVDSFQLLDDGREEPSTFAKVKNYVENNFPELLESLDQNSYIVRLAENKGYEFFVQYMTTPQLYQIVTRKSTWFNNRLNAGHHALMRLPGDRQCEWSSTPRTVPINEWTQLEVRQATGGAIEKIWNTHKQLEPIYRSLSSLMLYRPFKNDCFTYVNQLLETHGESPTRLTRFLTPGAPVVENLLAII